jgi:hypothetical protein
MSIFRSRRSIVLAIVAIISGWSAVLLPTVRRVAAREGTSAVVASPDEVLVIIPTGWLGWEGSPAALMGLWLARATGAWGSKGTHSRAELTVFVLHAGGVRRATFPGPGRFRGVVEGEILANAGGVLSRWTGHTFAPLADADRRMIESQGIDAAAAPAGWTVRPISLDAAPIEVAFTGDDWVYRLQGRQQEGVKQLVLVDASGAERVLWSIDTQPRFVSREDYAALFRP